MKRIFHITVLLALSQVTFLRSQSSATDSILQHWLKTQSVYDGHPVFNTFYFWTSFPDLDSSLAQNQLLRKSLSSDYYEEKLHDNLIGVVDDNEPISLHLLGAERQRVSAVWSCYWANINYDTAFPRKQQLVQVILMDSSLIVSFFPDRKKNERWKIHDLKGNLLTMDQAMQRKRHIAVVFLSGNDKVVNKGPRRTVFTTHYRSFFLCNENMIKSWHHAVPGLQAQVQNDLNYLVLLNAWFEMPDHCAMQGPKGKNCCATWGRLVKQSVSEYYFSVQRSAGYLEDGANQTTTTKMLNALVERWKLQMMPCERFPGSKK